MTKINVIRKLGYFWVKGHCETFSQLRNMFWNRRKSEIGGFASFDFGEMDAPARGMPSIWSVTSDRQTCRPIQTNRQD